MKSIILLQGHSMYTDEIYNTYGDECIFSTWKEGASKFKHTVFNDVPLLSGVKNCNLQLYSTYTGCLLAKQLGYSQVLKIRSDILIKDWKLLLDNLDLSYINFFSWHNYNGGYYVDYMFGGPIDDIIEITRDLDSEINVFPERRITNRVRKEVKYILPVMINKNISCYSLKWNKDLTKSCKEDNLFIY